MILHRPRPWVVPLLLWLLTCVLWLPWLGNVPLRDWDEAGIAQTALEFAQAVDLNGLLPSRWDEPYLNKPPGLHLLVALAIRLGGAHEAVLRLAPALLSTAAIPLVVLIQREVVPQPQQVSGQRQGSVAGEGLATGLILMTTLPMARHGRLLMLDGALVSAMLLLEWGLLLLRRCPRRGAGMAGLACSALLLLKPPSAMVFLVVGLAATLLATPPMDRQRQWRLLDHDLLEQWRRRGGLLCGWGLLGCLPGLAWHGWHLYGRGDGALVMWGRQGFGRLVQVLEGHNQGLSVPAFEILKGGWPWLLLLPLGLQLAWRQRQQTGGRWRLTVLAGCLGVVLSLKTQLPWYSHILWPPLACMEGPALARLWHGRHPGSLGLPLLLLGLVALMATVLQALTIVDGLPLAPLLMAGLAFGVSGILLLTGGEVRRSLGLVMAGWWLALLCLWSTPVWLWELNNDWPTRSAGLLVRTLPSRFPVFVEGAGRPSLSWYGGRLIQPRPAQPPFPHHLVVPGEEPLPGCQRQMLFSPSRTGQRKAVSLQWCDGKASTTEPRQAAPEPVASSPTTG
ncbi:MAG: glycosyltransferase [Cyanobacteria bacterium MAG CAR4_bin_6]|nr:glycosyltransferase [Cyanobacteria bacterium MAG CAR4_bin_6]